MNMIHDYDSMCHGDGVRYHQSSIPCITTYYCFYSTNYYLDCSFYFYSSLGETTYLQQGLSTTTKTLRTKGLTLK